MHDDAYIGGRSENNIKCVVQMMQRLLITVNVHHGCYLLFTQINLQNVFKMSAFSTYASCFQ